MKSILLVPSLCALFISGCSANNGEALAKAKMDAEAAKADAEAAGRNARAAKAIYEAKADQDLAAAQSKQIAQTTADIARIQADSVKICLVIINKAYIDASLKLKRPPQNLEELKNYLAKEFLVSPRDKQPFDFAWGEPGDPPPLLLAWEHTADAAGGRWIVSREPCQPSYVHDKLFPYLAPPPRLLPGIPKIQFTPTMNRQDFSKRELARTVEHVPPTFRQGISDVDLAKELEMVGIAFDYTSGPIQFWLEIEETGQQTILPTKYPSRDGWTLTGPEGHVFLGFRRSISERISNLAGAAKKEHSTEVGASIMLGDSTAPGKSFGHTTSQILWYGWKKHKLDAQYPEFVPRLGEELTLFVLTAEETTAGVKTPRKVKITLKAVFGPQTK